VIYITDQEYNIAVMIGQDPDICGFTHSVDFSGVEILP
jgi:hypothetical protein